jgi:hypothetical protein
MFTVKLVCGFKTRLLEAESFTLLHESDKDRNWSELTLHGPVQDFRYDLGDSPHKDKVECFEQMYIMNSSGKTIETANYGRLN